MDELVAAQEMIAGLEAELDAVNKRLLEAEKDKSHFVSHALNELNNPLAAIIGLTSQLLAMQQPAWDQVRDSLRWVNDEAVYLDFELRNLFMAAELESGTAQANVTRVDVSAIFNTITNSYIALAQRRGVQISFNGGYALLPTGGMARHFHTDAALIGLIYTNLLDNAIKFSPPTGVVRIYLDVTEDGLDMAFEDSGPGIPPELAEAIFDRFWQADSSTTKTYRGLGLGLAVTAGCVELLGGQVAVSPEVSTGARMTVHLPALQLDGSVMDGLAENVVFFDGETTESETTW